MVLAQLSSLLIHIRLVLIFIGCLFRVTKKLRVIIDDITLEVSRFPFFTFRMICVRCHVGETSVKLYPNDVIICHILIITLKLTFIANSQLTIKKDF